MSRIEIAVWQEDGLVVQVVVPFEDAREVGEALLKLADRAERPGPAVGKLVLPASTGGLRVTLVE